ncbi:DNA-directed RNA polymerase [Microbotryomycetes sp. JL201]|nr:DNA-directed RNA polymerase [Microbotryomycetes sp. JL201]
MAQPSPEPYSPPPTQPGRRSRSPPLYTVPPLPPLPPPLPADIVAKNHGVAAHDYAPTSVSSNAPAPQEQVAVLHACLASGDLTRAEEVAKRIKANWIKGGRKIPLSDLLPPQLHADFLRAYLSSALVPAKPGTTASFASMSHHATMSSKATRIELVAKAWGYFRSLFTGDWNSATLPHTMQMHYSVDSSIFAVMLKGLTAAGESIYRPTSASDPNGWLAPITYVLVEAKKSGYTVLDVLKDPIFMIDLPSYLGKVDQDQVLDAIVATGTGRDGWEDFVPAVEEARQEIRRLKEGRDRVQREALPELMPTTASDDSPNVSLETLRTNLSTLGMPEQALSMTPTQRQRLLEESSYDAARQLYIHEMEELAKVGKDKERGMQSDWLQSVMFDWMQELEKKLIEASRQTGRRSPWGRESDIEPFMRLLPPNKMALITIVELLRLCGAGGVSDGMKAARAILHIGRAVENEYHAQVLKQGFPNKEFDREMDRIAEFAAREDKDGSGRQITSEQTLDIFWRREMAKREKENDNTWRPDWSQGIRAKVGSILVTALMDVAKVERTMRHPVTGEMISEVQPAFSHAYQYVRGTKLGIIKINPAVAERIDSDPLRITLHPRFLPMVVKPKLWLSWKSGAYLVHSTHIMRTKESEEQVQYLKQASDANTLELICRGLDSLGAVPWKINRKVFDVVTEVWNSGEELADIPAKVSLTAPIEVEKPENAETDPRAKDSFRHRVRQALHERRANHSSRCDANYKLEIARAFLEETFYFPHNLDFRGRAYPIPPNLSHIGNDLCRGLLKFAEAKPLGERGLRWLKIHLANMAGYDKASFDEREVFAMEHLDDVYDSADNPLTGNRWWLKAEDPWQCLATCIELATALRSPDPTKYECGLPIHQDGTCNGLQHYAALGGDLKGANQVNLEAADRPADVYSGVAAMANEIIDKDAADGVPEAVMLKGKVTRKVVKQTVMTTVYGVTFIGAKKQIEKQLKERGDIPPENLYACSLYLGRIVLDSIGDVFKGATAIQTWLNRSARLIAKSIPPNRIQAALQEMPAASTRSKKGKKAVAAGMSRIPKEQMTSVVWTTPLGLPVVQPYRKPKKRQVATALQTVFIVDPSVPAEVDPRAQATAFPPNFIHSLDATHMMMTALACKDKIAFASVHDSYWTHACSVDEMSVILRDTFIELHSSDILGKLRQEFIDRYAGHVVPVSKVPAGLRFAQRRDEDLEVTQGQEADVSSTDVIAELEQEDGDIDAPMFGQGARVKRVATRSTTGTSADGDDVMNASVTSEQLDAVWRQPNAKSIDSKLVYLSDILPPVPTRGDFDLEKIRDSLYFFS